MSRLLLVLLLAGLVGGCASSRISIDDADLPSAAELTEVPFYPQEAYQCGPAALATMLAQRGVPADPDVLVDQVYIPGRRGSLQVEMVAAARAAGLLVYPLRSRLEDVLAEVAAGNPVLVLQNLWETPASFATLTSDEEPLHPSVLAEPEMALNILRKAAITH